MKEIKINKELRNLITEAVNAGIEAGKMNANTVAKDAFKATERRLYALPILTQKVIADRETLAEIQALGNPSKSKSLVRFQRTGYRVPPEEMLEAIINDLMANIAANENEIETVKKAMKPFEKDPFISAVTGRYVFRVDDDVIADELGCSTAQVWKQRTRIVKDIVIMLYGEKALQ